MMPDTAALAGGTVVAFCCAFIAVAVDLQTAVKAELGGLADTSVLLCRWGRIIAVGWGGFDAVMFLVVEDHRQWASGAFGFKVDENHVWTGRVVGVSAILIIRSKLAKVGSVEVGGEWAYLWSRAKVIDAVNRRRVAIKDDWRRRFAPAVRNIDRYPELFTDLESRLLDLLAGRPGIRAAVTAQLSELRRQHVPPGDAAPDRTINETVRARSHLVSVALDYFGYTEIESWARQHGVTN